MTDTQKRSPAAQTEVGQGTADGVTVPRRTLVLVFVALMLSMLMSSLNNTLISSATPTIVGELHGVEHIGWVITSFILSSTIVMPIYGNLSDLLGRKWVLICAIVIFMIGSVMGAVALNIEFLIAARLVQGLGGGGLMILSQAVIADIVPARDRGQYMGIMGGVFAFSSVAGPLLGGWLTDGPGWRWAFWINVPLGIAALIGTLLFLHLPKRAQKKARVDVAGMALLALATTAIVLVSVWGGTMYEWSSPIIIGLIVVAVVLVALFIWVESRAQEPVFPLKMFRNRNFILTTIASLAIGISMFGALGYMPTFLQMVTGLGAAVAGLLMIPMMATMLIFGVVVGRMVSVTGRYKWAPIVGAVVVFLALIGLGTVTSDTPVWLACAYLGVLGLGLGIAMQILVLVVQNEFPNSMVGTATAANNYFRMVGATLGSAVVGSVFATRLTAILEDSLPAGAAPADGASSLTPAGVWSLPDAIRDLVIDAYSDALMPIFLWIAPVALIGAIVAIFVKENPLATSIERDLPEVSTESTPTGQFRVASVQAADADDTDVTTRVDDQVAAATTGDEVAAGRVSGAQKGPVH